MGPVTVESMRKGWSVGLVGPSQTEDSRLLALFNTLVTFNFNYNLRAEGYSLH